MGRKEDRLRRLSRLEQKNLKALCQIIILSNEDKERKIIAELAEAVIDESLRVISLPKYDMAKLNDVHSWGNLKGE